jgi:hypothetical protein
MPKAFGRAGQILKRTSQVTLILEERVEGKNRKTKEQMEKEKKERLERNKKEEKEAREKQEEKEAEKKDGEPAKESISRTREAEGTKKESGKKTWGSRIFRRKSM